MSFCRISARRHGPPSTAAPSPTHLCNSLMTFPWPERRLSSLDFPPGNWQINKGDRHFLLSASPSLLLRTPSREQWSLFGQNAESSFDTDPYIVFLSHIVFPPFHTGRGLFCVGFWDVVQIRRFEPSFVSPPPPPPPPPTNFHPHPPPPPLFFFPPSFSRRLINRLLQRGLIALPTSSSSPEDWLDSEDSKPSLGKREFLVARRPLFL